MPVRLLSCRAKVLLSGAAATEDDDPHFVRIPRLN
jgi:hypothetical protein